MPIKQSLAAAAKVNPFNGADDDPVAMTFDAFLNGAIDDGERVFKAPSARGESAPLRAFVARRPVVPRCVPRTGPQDAGGASSGC